MAQQPYTTDEAQAMLKADEIVTKRSIRADLYAQELATEQAHLDLMDAVDACAVLRERGSMAEWKAARETVTARQADYYRQFRALRAVEREVGASGVGL